MEPARRRRPAARAWWITAISLVALAPALPARAQSAEARQRFVDAEELFAKGKVAEACALFEESNRIEPSAGTLINIGVCKEKLGKLASALDAFRDALARAKSPEKKKKAAEGIEALEPRVSRLTIALAPEARVEGLAVSRDGRPVDAADLGRAIPVDGGSYVISASAPGHRRWSSTIRVAPERDKVSIGVPKLAEGADGPKEGAGDPIAGGGDRAEGGDGGRGAGAGPAPPEAGGRSGRTTALKATGYGLVGLFVASSAYVMYLTVAGPIPDFESGKKGVPINPATGMEVTSGSSANCADDALRNYQSPGNRAFDEACKANRRRFIAGAIGLVAGVAGGVTLYVAYRRGGGTAEQPAGRKRREVAVMPVIGPDGGGATVRFAW